jgi:hypothetical protein
VELLEICELYVRAKKMNSNYHFKDSIYLKCDKHELDMHNDYDFVSMRYCVNDRTASLNWERSRRDGILQSLPKAVEISFTSVISFEFRPRDPELPFTEDDCLNTAGFLSPDNPSNEVFVAVDIIDPNWKHAFEFMSGAIIGIQANESKATIKP